MHVHTILQFEEVMKFSGQNNPEYILLHSDIYYLMSMENSNNTDDM